MKFNWMYIASLAFLFRWMWRSHLLDLGRFTKYVVENKEFVSGWRPVGPRSKRKRGCIAEKACELGCSSKVLEREICRRAWSCTVHESWGTTAPSKVRNYFYFYFIPNFANARSSMLVATGFVSVYDGDVHGTAMLKRCCRVFSLEFLILRSSVCDRQNKFYSVLHCWTHWRLIEMSQTVSAVFRWLASRNGILLIRALF